MKLFSEDIILIKDYLDNNKHNRIDISIFGDIIISKYKSGEHSKPELKSFKNEQLNLNSENGFNITIEPLYTDIQRYINEKPDLFNISRLLEYNEILLYVNNNLINTRVDFINLLVDNSVCFYDIFYKINDKIYQGYLNPQNDLLIKHYIIKDKKTKISLMPSEFSEMLKDDKFKILKLEKNNKWFNFEDLINAYKDFECPKVKVSVNKIGGFVNASILENNCCTN